MKAIFFDFDWTLFDHKTRSFVPSAIKAINAVHELGVKTYVNSARTYYALKELGTFKLLPFDGYVVNNGGAAFTTDKILYAKYFDKKVSDLIIKTAKEQHLSYLVVTLKDLFIEEVNNDENPKAFYSVYYEPRPRPMIEYSGDPVLAIQIFSRSEKDTFFDRIEGCRFNRFFETAAELTACEFHKDEGIKALIEDSGFKKEEIAAFGDDLNDIDMFNLVGFGICMGNGNPEAKKAAKWVTTNIEDDGIRNGLIHLGLLEK